MGKIFGSLVLSLLCVSALCQVIPSGNSIFNEVYRRNHIILRDTLENISFLSRPKIEISDFNKESFLEKRLLERENLVVNLIPIYSISDFNNNRPYGTSPFLMVNNVGLQNYLSTGISIRNRFFHFQIQPEFSYAQNRSYQGFSSHFAEEIIKDRFHFWNYNDSPERFSDGWKGEFWWGQSSLTFQYGAFEVGAATRNNWWGPGQFNSLTFSNNARGFPHFTLNTTKPAKTFLGHFEGQLLSGRLVSSMIPSSQNQQLNRLYFRPFSGDWRYINGITVSFNPKWVPGLFIGFSRTYQQFSENMGKSFADFFPIFSPFQKKNVFENGNSVDFDREGRDQQATFFFRYVSNPAKAELYFEYGRRDHAFSWREAILNPEHARAYLFGFIKLFKTQNPYKQVQFRGEITHQQESVNRYIRYIGLGGEATWHTHYQVRGFTNYGQSLGVGIGTGANAQTVEISLVDTFNKMGILFERIANHQDFYYRAFGQQKEVQPWVDLSIGFLFDKRWDQFLLSSKVQLINGRNYQWQLDPNSTPEFPKGQHLFSVHSQVSLIYLFQKNQQLNP